MIKFIKQIKEALKDPKKKAITSLVLYLLFFVFVYFIITSASDNISYIPDDTEEKMNYNYVIDIDENNIKTVVNGVYSDIESFNYNNATYTIKDNLIYLNDVVVDNPIKYNITDYYYDSINELIKKSEFIEKTTYRDNNTKTVYNIKVSDFFNNTNYECLDNCLNDIVISVYEESYIYNVIIDLTSVNNYKYIIDIKYEKTSD